VRDLRERATDLAARGLSAEGIAQVAGYLDDTIKEARRKMAEVETALRPASDAIVPRVFKQLKDRVAKLYFRQEVILPRKISATSADVRSGGSTTRFF
jgi:hypothetical protein